MHCSERFRANQLGSLYDWVLQNLPSGPWQVVAANSNACKLTFEKIKIQQYVLCDVLVLLLIILY